MSDKNSVQLARVLLVVICELLAISIALSTNVIAPWVAIVAACLFSGFVILIESLLKGFTLRGFSAATFGLLVGLFCAWLLTQVGVTGLIEALVSERAAGAISMTLNAGVYISLGFIGAVLALRSDQDDFAFVIPYVRFREDAASGQPLILDTDVILDGRVKQILAAGFLNGRLIIPSFVLESLKTRAESAEISERERAKRGIETLESLREDKTLEVRIHQSGVQENEEGVEQELANLCRLLGARLLTTDERLASFVRLQGNPVLNLNDLASALRPRVLVGERVRLSLVKPGKEEHQAVAYLADGSMVVVNHSAGRIGQSVDAVIISTLQTASGQMIFAELIEP